MAWTSPRTWAIAEIITAALLNTHLRDNLSHLYEQRVRSATGVTNLRIEHGSYVVGTLANGATDDRAINFSAAFSAAPTVVAWCMRADGVDAGTSPVAHMIRTGGYGETTSLIRIVTQNYVGSTANQITVGWIAIGTVA